MVEIIGLLVGLVFILFLITLFILSIVSYFSSSDWFCRVMGWHKAPLKQGFDGASLNGICPRCAKPVLKDSQGNWF